MSLSKNQFKPKVMARDNFIFHFSWAKKAIGIDHLLKVLVFLFFSTTTYGQAYSIEKQISYCQALMEQGLLNKAEKQVGFVYGKFYAKASPKHKARLLNLKGDCHFEHERIDSAYYYYTKSHKLHSFFLDSSLLAATWLKIGNCFEAQFDPGTALMYYEKVLEYTKKNIYDNLYVKALVTTALSKEREGNFDSAERYLKTAMVLAPKVKDPYLLAQTQFNYYVLLYQLSQDKESIDALTAHYLDLFNSCNKYQYKWLQARICIELSKLLEAKSGLKWCLKAETLTQAILPENHPFKAIIYQRLAQIYRDLDSPTLPVLYLTKALDVKKRHYGFQHIALWDNYLSLANAQQDSSTGWRLSILDSAIRCFNLRQEVDESTGLYKKIPLEALEVALQQALICVADTSGQYDQLSVQLFKKVIDQCALWRRYYVTPNQRRYFQGIIGKICNMAVDGCWKLHARQPKRLYMDWAFAFSERGKFVALQEQIIKKQLTMEEDVWARQIDSLERLLSGINSLGYFSNDLSVNNKIEIEQALEKAYAAWKKTESGREYDAHEPITLEELAKTLRKNETFISYHFSGSLYAFVVSSGRFDFYCLSYNAETIGSWKRWISRHHRNTDLNNYQIYGSEIFDELIRPCSIPADARVLIAPHGPDLNGLPFEALITKRDDQIIHWNKLHYWLNEQSIAYQPSASVWYSMKRFPFRYHVASFLGIAPDFSQKRLQCFSDVLEQNFEEVRRLAGIMASSGIKCDTVIGFTDKLNLLDRLKKSPSFVHFSTHGKPFADNLPAGIILNCEPNGDCKECILQYEEIAGIDMTHTFMATFSACSTAAGEDIVGEGLSSMVYAFVEAGVRNTVPTLFAVNETSANALFKQFYENLLHRKALPSEALNAAKREVAGNAKAQPADWAGFVYFGPDDAPILPRQYGHWLYAGALIGTLLAFIFWLRKKAVKP
jgi:CHAT domain-containing protein